MGVDTSDFTQQSHEPLEYVEGHPSSKQNIQSNRTLPETNISPKDKPKPEKGNSSEPTIGIFRVGNRCYVVSGSVVHFDGGFPY